MAGTHDGIGADVVRNVLCTCIGILYGKKHHGVNEKTHCIFVFCVVLLLLCGFWLLFDFLLCLLLIIMLCCDVVNVVLIVTFSLWKRGC